MANGKILNSTPPATSVRILGSGDNLNNLYGNRFIACYITTGVQNAPQDWVWCLVIGGVGTVQVCFSQNKIFERAYTGSPLRWTEWKRYEPIN